MINQYQKEYIYRINRVVDYINGHLDEDLSVARLAEIANFSQYHFHRIFSSIVGESLIQYIKRLRVEKAASVLVQDQDIAVSEVAFYCGFKSAAVFSRSFKERFGVSAIEYRKSAPSKHRKIDQLDSKNDQSDEVLQRYLCRVESLKQIQMKLLSKIEVKELSAISLIYARHTGAFDQIGAAYEKVFAWAGPRGLINSSLKTITVYHDNPDVTDLIKVRQSAGILVPETVKTEGEIGFMSLSGGKYIVGQFELSCYEFADAWDLVCQELAKQGYQPEDAFPYELYHKSDEQKKNFTIDICIPVKSL